MLTKSLEIESASSIQRTIKSDTNQKLYEFVAKSERKEGARGEKGRTAYLERKVCDETKFSKISEVGQSDLLNSLDYRYHPPLVSNQ